MGEAPFLEIERVEVAYGATRVLDDISLQLAEGEFLALLGASGCGKTTLLRAIAGFVPVRRGRILVAGRDLAGVPPERRGVAMVFQSYALWPHMTVAQNIAYGLKLRGVGREERRRRVERLLAMLGLEGLGGRRPGELSGGQRQRVALGRALAVDPRVLLLDEPLSNLDARIRQTVRHEIKELQQRLGITAVHVTHDREEAMVMADRIAILDAGRIVQLGTPREIYEQPNSPFVAAFMGAENELRLRVRGEGARLWVEPGPSWEAQLLPADSRDGGVRGRPPAVGTARALFRSETARVLADGEELPGALVMRGEVRQAAYLGGRWRYGVDVAGARLLIDDPRRFEAGDRVRVAVPAPALFLFAEDGAA